MKVGLVALLAAALALPVCATPRAAAHPGSSTPMRHRVERVGENKLDIFIAPGRLTLDDATLARLLGDSARAIAAYYAVPTFGRARITVTPSIQPGVHGATRCSHGGLVRLTLGPRVDSAVLHDDWIVTHELLHVVFTSLEDEQPTYSWVGEGLSSYLEPFVRVRAGTLSEDALWKDLLDGAPQGLPEPGDEGLNRTHTWGRTYWGGALFWLEVDLTIRQESQGKRSIRDALRAIAAAGTDICVDWPIERVIATGDAATGTHALAEVYARRALTNAAPDITTWWAQLGVKVVDGHAVFDDRAPWTQLRQDMTRD